MKFQFPWIRNASGTSAGLVFQTYRGRTYGHAKTEFYHYPNTPAQQDTQGKFYNIIRQFNAIYPELSHFIPRSQRQNRNVYNIFGSAMFAASLTYPNPYRKYPPQKFGVDKDNTLSLVVVIDSLVINDKIINVIAKYTYTTFRRVFTPKTLHVFFVNISQQEIIYTNQPSSQDDFSLTISNSKQWLQSDNIKMYVALSDQSFLSNFFKAKS